MKALIPILMIMFLTTIAKSQVNGRITDTIGNPVAFANVILKKSADSTFIRTVLSDKEGDFTIRAVSAGNYIIRVSCMVI